MFKMSLAYTYLSLFLLKAFTSIYRNKQGLLNSTYIIEVLLHGAKITREKSQLIEDIALLYRH